jgi:hypothetical protein
VTWLLRLLDRRGAVQRDRPVSRRRGRKRQRGRMTAVETVASVACAVAVLFGSGCRTASPPPVRACNGHAALCQRPLDRVALAATHNSMSVPLAGWRSVQQDGTIAEQLRDGIRGLLIDTHYAERLPDGKLRTDLTGRLARAADTDPVSPHAAATARRLRERLKSEGRGERGLYLCHSFCELGATPLADALHDLHDFLVRNPREVVVVINEDYVEPEDFVAAVVAAGLGELAYRGPTEGRWPTLREMIDRNERVVFLAEHRAGAEPWYHLAFERIAQETPYKFTRPGRLTDADGLAATCRDNRGPPAAPLFLVNHWITTDPVPRRADADKVNAYEPLLARLRTCARLRGHLPNLVAVNFYRRGELMRAVDTLNGVR